MRRMLGDRRALSAPHVARHARASSSSARSSALARRSSTGTARPCGRTRLADALISPHPRSGSGKTLITLALLRALKNCWPARRLGKSRPRLYRSALPRGRDRPPLRQSRSLGACVGLIDALLVGPAGRADLLLIEGVMGLFDGAARRARARPPISPKHLGLPVILVVDATHQSSRSPPSFMALRHFRRGVKVAGVILNRVAASGIAGCSGGAALPNGLVIGALPRLVRS